MEEEIKKKLDQLHIDWDKEALWEALEPQLDNPQPRRFRSSLLLLLLFIGVGVGVFIWTKSTCNGNDSFLAKNKTVLMDQSTDLLPITDKHNDLKKIKSPLQAVKETVFTTTQPIKNDSQKTNRNISPAHNFSTSHLSSSDKNITLDRASNNFSFQYDSKLAKIQSPFPHQNNRTDQTTFTPYSNQIIGAANIPSKMDQLSNTAQLNTPSISSIDFKVLESFPAAKLVPLNFDRVPLPFPIPPSKETKNTMVFEEWCLDFGFTSGTINRNISTKDNSNILDVETEELKNLERPLFNMGGQLLVSYGFKKGWSIQTGIHYHHIAEVLEWEDTYLEFAPTPTLNEKAYFQLDAQNDTIFHSGLVLASGMNTRNIIHNNRINYFSIPLNLGYELPLRKISLTATGGIHFAMLPNHKGKIISNLMDGPEQILIDPTINITTSVAFQFGLGCNYEFSKSSKLYLKAGYQQSPTFELNELLLNYQQFNLTIGLQRSLIKTNK